MAFRDAASLHVDQDLTNFSAGFPDMTDRYIGTLIAPSVPVSDKSDRFRIFNRDSWGRQVNDFRAPRARANELPPMTLSRGSYYTQEHALVDIVPREQEKDADAGLDALVESTERLSNNIMLNKELATITPAFTVGNFASGFTTTLSGTSQWSDYTTPSHPIVNIKAAVDAIHAVMFDSPNVVIMGYAVFRMLEDHPDIINRMHGAPLAVTTAEAMRQLFTIPPITIAQAGYVNAAYGAAESVAYMVGKDVLFAYAPPNVGQNQPSFMKTFVRPVGSSDGEVMPTERWYDIDTKSDKIRTSIEYDLQFITVDGSGKSAGAGYLIKNAVA